MNVTPAGRSRIWKTGDLTNLGGLGAQFSAEFGDRDPGENGLS